MYAEYFGLRDEPFSVTPDPRFFYENPMYREAYANLSWGIRARKGFISLIGEVGTGKTTLLRRLMATLEPTVRFIFVHNGMLSSDDLFAFLCAELGLPLASGGWPDRIRALKTPLVAQLEKGGTTALLVDEAQHLGDEVLETLRLLSNLEMPGQKLLQTLLVGQPELAGKLDQPHLRPLKQRIALQCRLDRLKYREVGRYIAYRLSTVGYKGAELFTPDAVQEISFYSNGIPRLINVICENALLTAYATSQRKVSSDVIREVARDLRLGPTVIGVGTTDWHSQGRLARAARATAQNPAPDTAAAAIETSTRRTGSGWARRKRRPAMPFRIRLLRSLAALGIVVLVAFGASVGLPDGSVRAAVRQGLESFGRGIGIGAGGRTAGHRSEGMRASDRAEMTARPEVAAPAESAAVPAATANAATSLVATGQSAEAPEENGKIDGRPVVRIPNAGQDTDGGAIASDAVEANGLTKSLVVEAGSTVSEIAKSVYGSKIFLALDLLKELNPQVENLNRILAGQTLRLPAITRRTLVREQPNGSYDLILASHPRQGEAEKLGHAAEAQGYRVRLTRRPVSDDLLLYRVEIVGLKDESTVNRAWETALASSWIATTINP